MKELIDQFVLLATQVREFCKEIQPDGWVQHKPNLYVYFADNRRTFAVQFGNTYQAEVSLYNGKIEFPYLSTDSELSSILSASRKDFAELKEEDLADRKRKIVDDNAARIEALEKELSILKNQANEQEKG